MLRSLLPLVAATTACTPSPQEAAMRSPSPIERSARPGSRETESGGQPSAAPPAVAQASGRDQAAQGPMPEAVSAAENLLPASPKDMPLEAQGRRTLSTAFVMVGPDGRLTVELRGGRVLVLRDVVMRPKDYCGVQVAGNSPGVRHCGGYAEVAAARPGG